MSVTVHPTGLAGLLVVEPRRFADARGWFMETWNRRAFDDALAAAGEPPVGAFVQDNLSRSAAGVLRGLHYQLPPHAQGKLVGVVHGAAWDVAVDLRRQSPTLGRWFGLRLDAESPRQLWIPPGFAHGFLALAEGTVLSYKTTDFYAVACERAIAWNDPRLAIGWPLAPGQVPVLNDKDARAAGWADAALFDA